MISLERLQQIIPPDQALANKALSVSLQQIAGITNMTMPMLARAVANLETTRNLPAISSLPQAVPPAVANDYIDTLGNNGKPLVVCDVLGIAAGYQVANIFVNTVSTLANTDVVYLTTIYETMNNVVVGTYGDPVSGPVVIPTGLPAAGTYYSTTEEIVNPDPPPANLIITTATAADNAFTGGSGGDGTGNIYPSTGPGLLSVAYPTIADIAVNSPGQVSTLNSYFTSMGAQVTLEKNLQAKAQIDFANLIPNSSATVYSLITSLPYYGQQNEQGGLYQFWEGVADLSTFTGQALVATLREGHNQTYLNNAGIQTNNHIPANPVPPIPPANLIPSTYSSQEAANIVIR
jgi:hypothetical protein